MGIALPTELLTALEEQCPCRFIQLQQLTALYSHLQQPPRNLVVYGLAGTGKLHTVLSVLRARQTEYAVVRSKECLSLRHLFSKIHSACVAAVDGGEDEAGWDAYGSRSESVNALSVNLQKLLRGRDKDLVLVLEGIDQQRGLTPNVLPALVRLGDIILQLSLVFIVTTPRALYLSQAGVPYLHFPPYNRAESISLITQTPPALAPSRFLDQPQALSRLQKWYSLFATTVYDSLHSPTSLSISHFRQICQTLWPRFVWPYISEEQPPGKGKAAQWDFSKLLVRQRTLLQTAGAETLAPKLMATAQATTFDDLELEQLRLRSSTTNQTARATSTTTTGSLACNSSAATPSIPANPSPDSQSPPLLSFFPVLLLTASYLASHTPPKLDILLFSRLSSSRSARSKRNYHRRKLFQSPSKSKPANTAATPSVAAVAGGGRQGRAGRAAVLSTPKKSKLGLELNLNLPRGFTLERVIAILRAIHPHGVMAQKNRSRNGGGSGVAHRVCGSLAELARLRLVVSVDGDAAAVSIEERRWRVNVPRAFVEELGGRYAKQGLAGLLRDYELVDG